MRKKESLGKNREISGHLPTLKCECGAEILFLPDLKEMSFAIEAHVAEHRKNPKDPCRAEAEAERVENDLISQAFTIANREQTKEQIIKRKTRAHFSNK
jgi:hypothetical protein